jgi:DNA-binding MarR family transcriptional regulator
MEDRFAALYLENQLCFPLYAASRFTTKVYAPYLEELGVTYPQYLVLLVLWQYGEQSIKDIGQRLYLESNTLTPLLKRLQQKGLLERNRSETDERTVLVSLTPEGQSVREIASLIPERIVSSFQSEVISEEELLAFQKTLHKLVGVLREKVAGE